MKNLAILTLLFTFIQCEPVAPKKSIAGKQLVFNNHNYENTVGAVQIGSLENGSPNFLENPIISLNQAQHLLLTFDLLIREFEHLSAKIYHCNKDWTKSQLRNTEFLTEINNFSVPTFNFSLNTTTSYINYQLTLPIPRLSGNYIVAIHRRGNTDDLLFTRKFLVIDSKSQIDHQVRISTTVSKRERNQQIEFSVQYGNIQVNAPTKDFFVVILQNHRWHDAIRGLKPTLIRPTENYMEFRQISLENNFSGWNEFRFFDMRSLNATGRNVNKLSSTNNTIRIRLGLDKSRGNAVYSQTFQDINGNFIIQNVDSGEGFLHNDYARVLFSLLEEPINGKVYVTGRFNNWNLDENNLMKFDSIQGIYQTSVLLKQGYYDYMYWVDAPDLPSSAFEGSHFQSENDYEILIYYRKLGNVHDELIGYKKFKSIVR